MPYKQNTQTGFSSPSSGSMSDTAELALRVRTAAILLAVDDGNKQQLKELLFQTARHLEKLDIRVHKKADGLLLLDGRGGCRFATLKERLLYRFFNVLPSKI